MDNITISDSLRSDKDNSCTICGKIRVSYCKDCNNYMCENCVESGQKMPFIIKEHTKCIECSLEICCFKSICHKCDINPYHMITDTIAVGSCSSDYKEFDVIVDLNYPENNVKENDISFYKKNGKLILCVGLIDNEKKESEALKNINEIIPTLDKYYKGRKILFHCYAGMSRSAAFAVSYLFYSEGMKVTDAHDLVKRKRKFIKINDGFMRAIKSFEEKNKR